MIGHGVTRLGPVPALLAGLLAFGAVVGTLGAADADAGGEKPVEAKEELAPPVPGLRNSVLDEVFSKGFIVPPPKPDDKTWMEDPFKNIHKEMGLVVFNLEKGQVARPVQVEQPQLIERFDQIIELLEKAQKSGSGTGPASESPTNPAGASSLAPGPGGQGEMRDKGNTPRKWAELTPKEREKILQSRTQGFPPGYEELLQDYFLKLATEEAAPTTGGKDGGDNAKPK